MCFACLGSGYIKCHLKSAIIRDPGEQEDVIDSTVHENLEQQNRRATGTASLEGVSGFNPECIIVKDPVENRLWACNRHSANKLTHITAHTLFGKLSFHQSSPPLTLAKAGHLKILEGGSGNKSVESVLFEVALARWPLDLTK